MPTEVQIFKDGTVVATDIADKTITATQIADKTITATQIADKTITATQIADNTITATQLSSAINFFPIGGIIMWSGSIEDIPTGWQLCNFSLIESGPLYKDNNPQVYTPNLTGRFIIAAGESTVYPVGTTGGSANATLVSHSHTASSTATDSGHSHSYTESNANNRKITGNSPSCNTGVFASTTGTGYANITVTTTIRESGVSATDANLPPYYALAFIMKVS